MRLNQCLMMRQLNVSGTRSAGSRSYDVAITIARLLDLRAPMTAAEDEEEKMGLNASHVVQKPATRMLASGERRIGTFLCVSIAAVMLSACGGDSDTSSGSGGGAPIPTVQNSPFAGTYTGTARVMLSALGESVDESATGSIVVRSNGTFGGKVLPSDGKIPCNTRVEVSAVNANGSFTYIESGSCDASSANLGNCSVRAEVRGQINGNRLSGSGPVKLDCGLLDAKGTVTINASR